MKKTYQNPTTIVVKVHPILMQAATTVQAHGSYDGSSKIESRRGFWDDDEDE